mmetsp:Transcript_41268/g.132946  ORF Transcript_41268/g.132946 Transcript_41268/m.132946 type:complete len:224 (-) Transcript_41268:2271-2942(-)
MWTAVQADSQKAVTVRSRQSPRVQLLSSFARCKLCWTRVRSSLSLSRSSRSISLSCRRRSRLMPSRRCSLDSESLSLRSFWPHAVALWTRWASSRALGFTRACCTATSRCGSLRRLRLISPRSRPCRASAPAAPSSRCAPPCRAPTSRGPWRGFRPLPRLGMRAPAPPRRRRTPSSSGSSSAWPSKGVPSRRCWTSSRMQDSLRLGPSSTSSLSASPTAARRS